MSLLLQRTEGTLFDHVLWGGAWGEVRGGGRGVKGRRSKGGVWGGGRGVKGRRSKRGVRGGGSGVKGRRSKGVCGGGRGVEMVVCMEDVRER